MEKYLLNHCVAVALDMVEARHEHDAGAWATAWSRVENHRPSAQLTCYLLALATHDTPPRPALSGYALAHDLILHATYPTGAGIPYFDRAHRLLTAAKSLQLCDGHAWHDFWSTYRPLNDAVTPETLTDMVLTSWRSVAGSRRAAIRGIRRDLNSLQRNRIARRVRNAVRYHLRGESQRRGTDGTYDYPVIPDFAAAQPPPIFESSDQTAR